MIKKILTAGMVLSLPVDGFSTSLFTSKNGVVQSLIQQCEGELNTFFAGDVEQKIKNLHGGMFDYLVYGKMKDKKRLKHAMAFHILESMIYSKPLEPTEVGLALSQYKVTPEDVLSKHSGICPEAVAVHAQWNILLRADLPKKAPEEMDLFETLAHCTDGKELRYDFSAVVNQMKKYTPEQKSAVRKYVQLYKNFMAFSGSDQDAQACIEEALKYLK